MPIKHLIVEHRVIDGDTIEATLDLGFGLQYITPVRLIGVSAPERNTPEGKVSKKKLEEFMQADRLVCQSSAKRGSFGRVLGRIYADGVDLNQRLIDEHYASVY